MGNSGSSEGASEEAHISSIELQPVRISYHEAKAKERLEQEKKQNGKESKTNTKEKKHNTKAKKSKPRKRRKGKSSSCECLPVTEYEDSLGPVQTSQHSLYTWNASCEMLICSLTKRHVTYFSIPSSI